MTKSITPLSQTLAPEAVLLATMPPLPDESCASWIQRMAGDHQYSMKKLMLILDVHASRRDWDLPIPLAAWLRILAVAGIRYLQYGYSPRVLSVLTTHIEPAKLFLHSAGRPHYRWCAQCLASDRVPYLRWHWRLRLVETCEFHRVALWQVCPMCSEPLWMDSSRLVAHGAQGLALDLAHCDRCGMPLHDEREQPRARASRADQLIWHSLKPFMAPWNDLDPDGIARVVMHFVVAARLKNSLRSSTLARLEFGTDVIVGRRLIGTPFGVAAAYARAAANAAWLRSARDQSGRWTLNAVSFRPPAAEPQGSNAPIVRWSWRLGAERRLKLARALRTIRREKKSAEQERIE